MIGYGWRRTRSLNVAAALAACGIKVLPVSALHEHTGKRITEFHLRDTAALPAALIPAEDPQRVRARFDLRRGPSTPLNTDCGIMRRHLEDDTLEAADPEHPALDALRVLEARECLLTFANRGTRYRIEVHPTAPRSRLVPGQEPLAHAPSAAGTWNTRDLSIAAGMARIGVPVLDIRRCDDRRAEFVLPRYGHPLPGRFGPEDAVELFAAFRSGELMRQCPEHPLIWGWAACKARLMLLQAIENRGAHSQVFLHFQKSGSWNKHRRSALVEERAPNSVLDQAIKHLRAS